MNIGSYPSIVILATADFDSEVWTNKQHLATRLSHVADVTYVESFGLRRPRLHVNDVGRMWRRLVKARRGPEVRTMGEGCTVRVVRPLLFPWHGNRVARGMNRLLVRALVRTALPHLGESVLWSFSPLVYGIDRRAAATVYHSVDLVHEQPRMPAAALIAAEARMVHAADRVIASSTGVEAHLRKLGATEVHVWENVADVAVFADAVRASKVAGMPRQRRAILAGNLTESKLDLDILESLNRAGIPLAVAGPREIDGTATGPRLARLLAAPNVEYLGNLAPQDLAAQVAASMVGLIPYKLNGYTAGVFPLKVYEYLAGGLCVVSTSLPSLRESTSPVVRAETVSHFVRAVRDAIDGFDEREASVRQAASASHSWEQRTADAVEVLGALE